MSSKLGTILGLSLIFLSFILGVDLVLIQYNYVDLDSISVVANYEISKLGYITNDLAISYADIYKVKIYPDQINSDQKVYDDGFIYKYFLEKEYKPIFISESSIKIKIQRFSVINMYSN